MHTHHHLNVQQTLDPNSSIRLDIRVSLATQPDQAVVTVSLKAWPGDVCLAMLTAGYPLSDDGMADLGADMFGWLLAARNELAAF